MVAQQPTGGVKVYEGQKLLPMADYSAEETSKQKESLSKAPPQRSIAPRTQKELKF